MNYLDMEIILLDFITERNPTTISEYENLAEELHEMVERAIQESIHDHDGLDVSDYESSY